MKEAMNHRGRICRWYMCGENEELNRVIGKQDVWKLQTSLGEWPVGNKHIKDLSNLEENAAEGIRMVDTGMRGENLAGCAIFQNATRLDS